MTGPASVGLADPLGQSLCLECGLCCRGVWFDRVVLDPGEVDDARAVGLSLQFEGGEASFRQPCVLHQRGRCSAYGKWRPRICGEYRCALLASFVAGKVDWPSALQRVTQARQMADRIQAEIGHPPGGLMGPQVLGRVGGNDGPAPADLGPLSDSAKVETVALVLFYKKHFRPPKDSDTAANS